MVDGTRNLIAAAREAGVGRFVHMSALGVSEETKDLVPYFGAKWQMEQDVEAAEIPHVIFRPSFIFAKDGGILPTFAKLARLTPVTPIIGGGKQRIQPIWADDVGAYFSKAVDLDARDRPDVRARRARRRDVERVLGATEARARHPPPEHPHADVADAR